MWPRLYTTTAFPLVLLVLCAAGTLFVGMASSDTNDEDREWWARLGAWMLIVIVGWLLASTVVFFGPSFVRWIAEKLSACG